MWAMALLKALMTAGMVAAVMWRLGSPITRPWWTAYALACAGAAAGPGLIWQMAAVRAGALTLRPHLITYRRSPSDQRHLQFVENRRKARRRNQRTCVRRAELGSGPIVDGQVRLPVQARRVDDAVWRGRVLMESQ